MYLSNRDAKNVAMSSEGISSAALSTYELFLNMLQLLRIKIIKAIIKKSQNKIIYEIQFKNKDNKQFSMFTNNADAIILSLKSLANIYIDQKLLIEDAIKEHTPVNLNESVPKKHILKHSIDSKLNILTSALHECIEKENFESAAFLRDRIKVLNKNK